MKPDPPLRHHLQELDPTARYGRVFYADGEMAARYLLLAPEHEVAAAAWGDDQTAVHEAGHVVVAAELGVAVDYVSIIVNKRRGVAGCTITRGDGHEVIDYAGAAAVAALLGIDDGDGAAIDFAQARAHVQSNRRRMAQAKKRALEIITSRRDCVRLIANALLARGRLTHDEIEWLLYTELPLPRMR